MLLYDFIVSKSFDSYVVTSIVYHDKLSPKLRVLSDNILLLQLCVYSDNRLLFLMYLIKCICIYA